MYDTTESSGSLLLTVNRANGSVGAASVSYATADGTAVAGKDYTATGGVLQWADGDKAGKTIQVGIIDQGLVNAGTRTFQVTLGGASGASLGSASSVAVNIALNDAAKPRQPTVRLFNPPEGVKLVAGSMVLLGASVTDTAGVLIKLEFFLNGALRKSFAPGGPYLFEAAGLAAGGYTLRAVATDSLGRTSEATRRFTIIAEDTVNPTPGTVILGGYDGRLFPGGSFLTFTATADTFGLDASLLERIAFYYEGILIAAYDGDGHLLPGGLSGLDQFTDGLFGSARLGSAGRLAELFHVRFQVPKVEGPIRLTTVVTGRTGISRVSGDVSFRATATGTSAVTAAAISGIAGGATVALGTPLNFTVKVTGTASSVEYYVNGVRAGGVRKGPYTFRVPTPKSGSYVLSALVTDANGLATATSPVTVQVAAPAPTVSFVVPGANGGHSATVAEGGSLKLKVMRSGDDFPDALVVKYKASGSAKAGRDYRALSGSVTIPAGKASTNLKLSFPGDDARDGTRILKLKLLPGKDGAYRLGGSAQASVRILDGD